MPVGSPTAMYERERRQGWTVWLHRARWREEWWSEVLAAIDGRDEPFAVSRHARTTIVSLPAGGEKIEVFAKVYRPAGGRGGEIKDLARASKPLRALRAGLQLAADGFHVPLVLAAGERRRFRRLCGGFLLTERVAGLPLKWLAEDLRGAPAHRRRIARALGGEVGRLHRLGYVHGDLVATNILVDEGPPPRFRFLDHDRTGRWPGWGGWHRCRRNLIQLNRLPLPGVTHGDRLRAFIAYAGTRGWSRRRWRREARWLAAATQRRRRQLARITARKAMRVVSPG